MEKARYIRPLILPSYICCRKQTQEISSGQFEMNQTVQIVNLLLSLSFLQVQETIYEKIFIF